MSVSHARSNLLKYLVMSSLCLLIAVAQGALQVVPPIHAWLVSIGSPNEGPGHMIDPLAHAHIGILGGMVIFIMGATFYLLPRLANRPVYSQRLIEHTFWWTASGSVGIYLNLLLFGIYEGHLLHTEPARVAEVHRYYERLMPVFGSLIVVGLVCFFSNVLLTALATRRAPADG